MTEHLLGILSSLLRSLPADSAERIRLLAKFVEKDYEKLSRLVQIRRDYASRLSTIDQAITEERARLSPEEQEDRADTWFSRRLDAGLFSLQTVDVILTWLVAEDSGARVKIKDLLAERDETFEDLRKTLREQLEGMDARGNDEGGDGVMKDMLGTLVGFLE
jgi:beta-catenin-like protein 1